MIDQLTRAYHVLETDEWLRCGVLFAHGEHFTGGLDLAEVGPVIREGRLELSGPVVVTPGARTASGRRRSWPPSKAG